MICYRTVYDGSHTIFSYYFVFKGNAVITGENINGSSSKIYSINQNQQLSSIYDWFIVHAYITLLVHV